MEKVAITECPRDAMQGIHDWIPTEKKVEYLNLLLDCGFETLDFGSFVSPKAIPQMKDTAEVLEQLIESPTRLLAIIANERGAEQAASFDRVDIMGYPFSISETFQLRNTNATIDESLSRVEQINEIARKSNKELLLYLSMGFGNPYGDPWHEDLISEWSEKLYSKFEIKQLALSDTIGIATPELVKRVFEAVIPAVPQVVFGAHLHTVVEQAKVITEAAYSGGCRNFDGAIKGFGGCPMAKNDLTGNMPTELMLDWFNSNSIDSGVKMDQFKTAFDCSSSVFPV